MTTTPSNEDQKVSEWLSGYGYQPFNVPDDIERFRGDDLPDITLQQATFFYRERQADRKRLLDKVEKYSDGDPCTVRFSDGSVERMRVIPLQVLDKIRKEEQHQRAVWNEGMKLTFEEELKGLIESVWYDGFETANAIGRNDPRFGNQKEELESDVSIAFEKIATAHQAEMDRVVEEVIGGWVEPEHDTDDEIDRVNNQNLLISIQRARYKAIKDKK